MQENRPEAQGDAISFEVAGRLLMIGPDRIRQLIRAGYIAKVRPGYTTIVSAVQGYIRFLKDEDRKNTKAGSASRATDARTREIELRIAERKRDLIPQEDARAVVLQIAAEYKAEFIGLPARYTRGMTERRRLEKEIDASFDRIADALAGAEQALATGFGDNQSEPEA